MRYALIAARKSRDWTQAELAEQVGVERSSIAKYEGGWCDIPGKVLQRLENVLNIPMSILYVNSDKLSSLTHRKEPAHHV
jgi:transcriptional regulator with XRE-family HTH domain